MNTQHSSKTCAAAPYNIALQFRILHGWGKVWLATKVDEENAHNLKGLENAIHSCAQEARSYTREAPFGSVKFVQLQHTVKDSVERQIVGDLEKNGLEVSGHKVPCCVALYGLSQAENKNSAFCIKNRVVVAERRNCIKTLA